MIYIGKYHDSEVDNYKDYIVSKVDEDLRNQIVDLLNVELKNSGIEEIKEFEDLIKMDFSRLSLINDHLKGGTEYSRLREAIDFFKARKSELSSTKKNDYLKLIYSRILDSLNNELEDHILTKYKKLYSYFHKEREKGGLKNNIILAKALDVSVCPYCNRNFINTRGDSHSGRQYDHFFSRDKVPYFALSLYNLVPTCSTCNHMKSNNEQMECCPFDKRLLENENRLRFNVEFPSGNITLKNTVHDIDILKLNETYEINSLDVKRLFNAEKMYCREYRNKLLEKVESRYHYLLSEQQFDRMIYGDIVVLDHTKFRNEILSYLKYDTYQTIKKCYRGIQEK